MRKIPIDPATNPTQLLVHSACANIFQAVLSALPIYGDKWEVFISGESSLQ